MYTFSQWKTPPPSPASSNRIVVLYVSMYVHGRLEKLKEKDSWRGKEVWEEGGGISLRGEVGNGGGVSGEWGGRGGDKRRRLLPALDHSEDRARGNEGGGRRVGVGGRGGSSQDSIKQREY